VTTPPTRFGRDWALGPWVAREMRNPAGQALAQLPQLVEQRFDV